jgi:hypothetical protein
MQFHSGPGADRVTMGGSDAVTRYLWSLRFPEAILTVFVVLPVDFFAKSAHALY